MKYQNVSGGWLTWRIPGEPGTVGAKAGQEFELAADQEQAVLAQLPKGAVVAVDAPTPQPTPAPTPSLPTVAPVATPATPAPTPVIPQAPQASPATAQAEKTPDEPNPSKGGDSAAPVETPPSTEEKAAPSEPAKP